MRRVLANRLPRVFYQIQAIKSSLHPTARKSIFKLLSFSEKKNAKTRYQLREVDLFCRGLGAAFVNGAPGVNMFFAQRGDTSRSEVYQDGGKWPFRAQRRLTDNGGEDGDRRRTMPLTPADPALLLSPPCRCAAVPASSRRIDGTQNDLEE